MVRSTLRLVSLVTAGLASSGFVIYGAHSWDPNDFGVVRIGRAVLTVSDPWTDSDVTYRSVWAVMWTLLLLTYISCVADGSGDLRLPHGAPQCSTRHS